MKKILKKKKCAFILVFVLLTFSSLLFLSIPPYHIYIPFTLIVPLLLNTLKHTRWNSSSSGGDNNNNNNNNDGKNLQDNLLEELKASFDELAIIDAQKESAQKEYAHKHGKSADPSTRLSSTEAISNLAKAVEKEVGSTTTLSADTISTMVARLPVHLRESFPVLNGFALPKPEYIEMVKQRKSLCVFITYISTFLHTFIQCNLLIYNTAKTNL